MKHRFQLSEDLFDPKKLISLVRRYIWIIFLCIIISVSITYYVVNYYEFPVYESEATLIITTNENTLPGSEGEGGSSVGDIVSRSFTSIYGNPVQNAIYFRRGSYQSYSAQEAALIVNLAFGVFQERLLEQKQTAASKAL